MISLADHPAPHREGRAVAGRRACAVARRDRRAGEDHRRLCAPRATIRARRAAARCAASRSASRTSSTPRTCRPRWARRSIKRPPAARGCAGGDAAEAGRRDHRRQDHDHGVCGERSDARRSIRTITAIRRAARRRARRQRSAAGMIPLALGTQTGGSVIRPGLVLRRRRDQAVLPAAADGRRQMLFLDARHRRPVRGRRRGRRARAAAMTNRPELLRCPAEGAAHRRGDAGICRPAGEGGRRGAAGIAARAAAKAGASVRELKMPEIVAEAWRIHTTVQQFEAHQAFAWEYRRELRRDAAAAARPARRQPGHPAGRI